MQSTSRKRLRSGENVFSLQRKTFINQHIVNSHDEEKMREIQDRTIKLLFKGARSLYNGKLSPLPGYEKNIRLSGDGTVQFIQGKEPEGHINARAPSRCCKKLALIRHDCSNCSLAVCEFCGYSCVGCGSFLCTACVCLFDCGGDERPCCFQCQYFDMK